MKDLMVFEGKSVEVFELKDEVYFNPYHAGMCLGMSESSVRRLIDLTCIVKKVNYTSLDNIEEQVCNTHQNLSSLRNSINPLDCSSVGLFLW